MKTRFIAILSLAVMIILCSCGGGERLIETGNIVSVSVAADAANVERYEEMPDDVSMLVSAINSLTDDKKTPFDDGAGFPDDTRALTVDFEYADGGLVMLTVWLFPDETCAVRVLRQEKDTQSVLAVFGVDEPGIVGEAENVMARVYR